MFERENHLAEECIFIDSTVKNLVTVQSLAMDTILFNRDNEMFS